LEPFATFLSTIYKKMIFTSPLSLLALAPWAALVLWLLTGRPEKSPVPFLHLWPSRNPQLPKPKRAWQKPPLWLIAIFTAMLLAIFAAAGPRILHQQTSRITVIVDRGFASEFKDAAKNLDASLRQNLPNTNINLKMIPTTDSTTSHDWLEEVSSLQPTAADDIDELTLACRNALRESDAPVVLLSDQTIQLADPRLIQFTSSAPITNVGIDLLSVRTGPQTQAMIRLFNQSDQTSAQLIIRADGTLAQSRQITLPAPGTKKNYFVDLPSAPAIIESEIQCNDSIKINHRAWLVRQAAWPIIDPAGYLPPELTRLIEVYTRHRIPSEDSQHITITSDPTSAPTNMPVAILTTESNDTTKLTAIQPLIIKNDLPNMESIDWPNILPGALISPAPGKDWRPIVTANGSVILAIRDTPTRQAWIGFQANNFAHRPDFVIFWTAIFDWLGSAGASDYTSQKIGPLAANWHLQQPTDLTPTATDNGLIPGLYKSTTGALTAINAPAPQIPPPPISNASAKLKALIKQPTQSASLASATLLLSITLIAFSFATWKRPARP
jgi:hypothetical protein